MKLFDFLRNRSRVDRAMAVLEVIERLAEGVMDRAELARRLGEGAHRGDLDDVVAWAQQHDDAVRRFRKGR